MRLRRRYQAECRVVDVAGQLRPRSKRLQAIEAVLAGSLALDDATPGVARRALSNALGASALTPSV